MKKLLFAALLTTALIPAAAFGSSIEGTVEGEATGYAWNPTIGGTQSCNYGFSTNITSGSCSYTSTGQINTGPWVGQGNSYTADVHSSADLTNATLHAYAGQTVTNFPIDTQFGSGLPLSAPFDADAIATVGDTLNFVAPGQNVPLQIVFKVGVDGVIKSFDSAEAGGDAELDYGSGFFTHATFFDSNSGGTIYTTPAATVTSNSYNFFFTLTANSEIDCGQINATHLCSASESSDFSDTAQIVAIILEDASGNQLNGYTVSSSSGVNYDSLLAGDPNAAPEPATWALAGGVLFIGLGMRRRSAASAAGATRHS